MARDRHQRKQIERALQDAEEAGCDIDVRHRGHTWGRVVAPNGQRFTIFSMPKNPDVAARMIRKFVERNT